MIPDAIKKNVRHLGEMQKHLSSHVIYYSVRFSFLNITYSIRR